MNEKAQKSEEEEREILKLKGMKVKLNYATLYITFFNVICAFLIGRDIINLRKIILGDSYDKLLKMSFIIITYTMIIGDIK